MSESAPTNYLDCDLVRAHLSRAGERAADAAREMFARLMALDLSDPMVPFGSPAEVVFHAWFMASTLVSLTMFRLRPQLEVETIDGRFRLDFALQLADQQLTPRRLEAVGLRWPRIAIEVDGHAFHEKTLEQATYRNRRDRALQQEGWKVFHYSFDELTSHPRECIEQVLVFARERYLALTEQVFDREHPDLAGVRA